MEEYIITLVFSLAFNIVMFIPAFIWKTDKLTDISYALTFGAVGLYGYFMSERSIQHLVLLLMIALWSVRLGGFLYMRISRMKVDRRFDGMREKFFKFLGFWLLQGLTVSVVLTASTLFFNEEKTSWSGLAFVGLVVFTVGLALEAVADAQKFAFSGIASNKDKWIESGVWSVSRHPNYLGEILVWLGVYFYVAVSLSWPAIIIALISPLYIAGLLLFVSGVPLLEKSADKKWGKQMAYQEYKKRTPVLIPFTKW